MKRTPVQNKTVSSGRKYIPERGEQCCTITVTFVHQALLRKKQTPLSVVLMQRVPCLSALRRLNTSSPGCPHRAKTMQKHKKQNEGKICAYFSSGPPSPFCYEVNTLQRGKSWVRACIIHVSTDAQAFQLVFLSFVCLIFLVRVCGKSICNVTKLE